MPATASRVQRDGSFDFLKIAKWEIPTESFRSVYWCPFVFVESNFS
jgi:hypothetical protein